MVYSVEHLQSTAFVQSLFKLCLQTTTGHFLQILSHDVISLLIKWILHKSSTYSPFISLYANASDDYLDGIDLELCMFGFWNKDI